jgi:uncharacterized membrane protein
MKTNLRVKIENHLTVLLILTVGITITSLIGVGIIWSLNNYPKLFIICFGLVMWGIIYYLLYKGINKQRESVNK